MAFNVLESKVSSYLRCVCWCAVLVAGTFAGCESRQMQPKLITEPGKYLSPDKKYELIVAVENNIVSYQICTAGAGVPLINGRVGSVFHKVFLMWDDQNNVWIDGEDINRVIFFDGGKFRPHDKTVADYKNPYFVKPPAEWNGPDHR